jgi:hypothetical protein
MLHRFAVAVRFLLAVLVLPAAFGCTSKKNLDKTVDKLVAELQGGDRAGLLELLTPEVQAEVTQQVFDDLAGMMRELGAYKDRTMNGINVASGGSSRGTYDLTFDAGQVTLELNMQDDKIVGFDFQGPVLEAAKRRYRAAQYAAFEVHNFFFVGPDDKPSSAGNIAKSDVKFKFAVEVQGVVFKDGKSVVRTIVQVQDPERNPLGDPLDMGTLEIAAPGPDPLPLITITGSMSIRQPGTYPLLFRIEDVNAGKSLEYVQSVIIEP